MLRKCYHKMFGKANNTSAQARVGRQYRPPHPRTRLTLEALEDRCMPASGLDPGQVGAMVAVQQSAVLGDALVTNAPDIMGNPFMLSLAKGFLRQDALHLDQAAQMVKEGGQLTPSGDQLQASLWQFLDGAVAFAQYRDSLFGMILDVDLTAESQGQPPTQQPANPPPPPPAPQPVENAYTLFVNPADKHLLQASNSDGSVVDYFGAKDANGLVKSITSAIVTLPDGHTQTIQYDASARPVHVFGQDGSDLSFTWISDTQLVVSALTGGEESFRVNVPIDLQTSKVSSSLAAASLAPAGETPLTGQLSPSPSGQLAMSASTSSSMTTATGLIHVTQCGAPVSDAEVFVYVKKLGPLLPGETLQTFYLATPTANPGEYEVLLPISPSNAGANTEEILNALADALGKVCELSEPIEAYGPNVICPALATAAGVVLKSPTAAAKVAAVCESGVAALVAACKVAGQPGGGELIQVLNKAVKYVVDALANDSYDMTATATLSTGKFIQGSAVKYTVGEDVPTLNLDDMGSVKITSFTTDPVSPASSQGYAATAGITCAAPDTLVTMSVVGTDGYTNSTTQKITGNGTVTLEVPGGAQGVHDTITVQVADGPSQTIGLVFG